MSTLLKNIIVLVVDDDPAICDLLRSVLEESGASVVVARSIHSAIAAYRHCPPHAIVAEIRLGSSDGYALIKTIRDTTSSTEASLPRLRLARTRTSDRNPISVWNISEQCASVKASRARCVMISRLANAQLMACRTTRASWKNMLLMG